MLCATWLVETEMAEAVTTTMASLRKLKQLAQQRQRLGEEHDRAQALLQREFRKQQKRLVTEMEALVPGAVESWRALATSGRADYLDNWANGGRYSFRSDPFHLADLGSGGEPVLLAVLAMGDERFNERFFVGLGAMELFNVYRTSRAMRQALEPCLAACLTRIAQDCRAEHWEAGSTQSSILLGWSKALATYGAQCHTSAKCRAMAPRLMRTAYEIHRHFRWLGPIVLLSQPQLFQAALCFQLDAEGRLAPLSRVNLFVAADWPEAARRTMERRRRESGLELSGELLAQDLMDHSDWLKARLSPFNDQSTTRRAFEDLLIVERASSTIRPVCLPREAPTPPGYASVVQIHCTREEWRQGRATLLVDHYELRLCLSGDLTAPLLLAKLNWHCLDTCRRIASLGAATSFVDLTDAENL